jgi:DNA repair photolyase
MPVESISGRGATRNATPTRFHLPERLAEGDWLDEVEALDGTAVRRTTVTIERPKSILSRNQSPDIGFDRSINPYRGCEHGCVYCFARPTHAYHDLSPGVDFESRLFAKPDAAKLLHAALVAPGYDCAPSRLAPTPTLQPIRGQVAITRSVGRAAGRDQPSLHITTKSDRVLRDLDLIGPAAHKGLVAVAMSVTSLDPAISRTLEPRHQPGASGSKP